MTGMITFVMIETNAVDYGPRFYKNKKQIY